MDAAGRVTQHRSGRSWAIRTRGHGATSSEATCALFGTMRGHQSESASSNSRAAFLRRIRHRKMSRVTTFRLLHRGSTPMLPPPADSQYRIIEEDESHLLVEIPVNLDGPPVHRVPFITTRLLLNTCTCGWQIADIFEPCVSCNLNAIRETNSRNNSRSMPGQCEFCSGEGNTFRGLAWRRHFLWFRKRVEKRGPCEYCNGSGRCRECVEEFTPGWVRAHSLRRRHNVTSELPEEHSR